MGYLFENKVIVFGGNHHNTLGVIRSLGKRGIKVYALIHGGCKSFVGKSRYITKSWIIDREEDGIELLIKQFAHEKVKPVIICCSDGASSVVDSNYEVLKKYFYFPNAGQQGRINELMNKETMRLLAEECGMLTPSTWSLKIGDNIPEDIKYPCITKPLCSIEGSKADIYICQTSDELIDSLQKIHSKYVQIQEYIDKEFEFQLIGCSLNGGEQVVIPGISKIIRASKISNTGFLSYIPCEQFDFDLTFTKNFIKRTGYSGLFSVEFLRSRSGETYFMEINFRNDGNAYSVTAAGCNLPYIWTLGHAGGDIENEPLAISKPIYVMPETIDFITNVLKGDLSFGAWLKDVRRSQGFLLFNKKDIKPWLWVVKDIFMYKIKKNVSGYLKGRWNIGFIDFDENLIWKEPLGKIYWLKHAYKDRWFADPFILSVTDSEIEVLVEEFYDPIDRGRISKLVIDKNSYTLKKCIPILELDTHLSFPVIFRANNEVYIYPESSRSQQLVLYRYDCDSETVEVLKVLSGEPLTDATITTLFGSPYLFSTRMPEPNKNILNIYSAHEWDGDYRLKQSVTFQDNTARNAGEIFKIGNRFIRPAQDCNGAYGRGIVFQEVFFQDGMFSFQELKRHYPKSWRYHLGMHTFSVQENIAVVDGRGYRNPIFGHFIDTLREILHI